MKPKIALFFVGAMFLPLMGCSAPATPTPAPVENANVNSSSETAEVPKGPVPFSDVKNDIMDAKESWDFFTFETAKGTCMEQGFPTNMRYTSGNVMRTEDGTYLEDWTSVDFTGTIRFDDLPLSTGKAACVMKTISGEDFAKVTCSVDEKEVCTATFTVMAHRK